MPLRPIYTQHNNNENTFSPPSNCEYNALSTAFPSVRHISGLNGPRKEAASLVTGRAHGIDEDGGADTGKTESVCIAAAAAAAANDDKLNSISLRRLRN